MKSNLISKEIFITKNNIGWKCYFLFLFKNKIKFMPNLFALSLLPNGGRIHFPLLEKRGHNKIMITSLTYCGQKNWSKSFFKCTFEPLNSCAYKSHTS